MLFTRYINVWDEARINIVIENCVLLRYYAASSSIFLQTFRDNSSVPSSWVKNSPTHKKKQFTQYGVCMWNSMGGDKFSVAWRSMKTLGLKFTWP